VKKLVDTTEPTAGKAIELLVLAGVLVESTGKKRDRSYVYRAYLDLLKVGTELDRPARWPSSPGSDTSGPKLSGFSGVEGARVRP
jgi:hypothetical protein